MARNGKISRRVGSFGGSTLTMQVARLLDPHPKTFGGKIRRSGARCNRNGTGSTKLTHLNRAPFGGTLQGIVRVGLTGNRLRICCPEAAMLAVRCKRPAVFARIITSVPAARPATERMAARCGPEREPRSWFQQFAGTDSRNGTAVFVMPAVPKQNVGYADVALTTFKELQTGKGISPPRSHWR